MTVAQTLRSEADRWVGTGLDLLFPPRCALCHDELDAGPPDPVAAAVPPRSGRRDFCRLCSLALTTDVPRCERCGEPGGGRGGCRRCGLRRDERQGIVVLAAYGDRLRDAVLRSKRPGGEVVAGGLARLLLQRHGRVLRGWGVDAVVPVPMHWLRRMTRGASAAEEVARALAAPLGLPLRPLLRRWRCTRMQNELPVSERRDNVRGAFRVRRAVAGLRVLLVDDVVTTGSTIAACRRALLDAGAAAVFTAVVARADRTPDRVDP